MKTYILEENYGEMYRITVEDDVDVSVNSYESSSESANVKFTRPTVGYENTVLAAFSGVRRMYQEGTELEKKTTSYNAPVEAMKSDVERVETWTTV